MSASTATPGATSSAPVYFVAKFIARHADAHAALAHHRISIGTARELLKGAPLDGSSLIVLQIKPNRWLLVTPHAEAWASWQAIGVEGAGEAQALCADLKRARPAEDWCVIDIRAQRKPRVLQ